MADAAILRPARSLPVLYGAAALLGLLILWTLATSVFNLVPSRVLPSPLAIVGRFGFLMSEDFSGATLFGHALRSLERWAWGVGMAILLGVPLGALLSWLPPVRSAVTPVFEFLRYIPPFAWVPIAVLWMGASTATQALIVFIAAFPACVINAQLGIRQVDPILPMAARVQGAGGMTTLLRVVAPVAAPTIFTGIRIALTNGWMALVGAELIVGKQGLGFLISQGLNNNSVTTIFVGIIAIGVLGAAIDFGVQRLQILALPWRKPDGQQR